MEMCIGSEHLEIQHLKSGFRGFKKTFLCYQPQNQITIKSHCTRVQVEILGKSRWIVFGGSEAQD